MKQTNDILIWLLKEKNINLWSKITNFAPNFESEIV